MIPKSLTIFIAFGVVSGFAFGSYLIDLKNTNELVFVEGSDVSIFTDKADYKTGEAIKIRIVNSGSVPLSFSDATYDLEITGLSGRLMYEPRVEEVPSDLEPRDEIQFVWNQHKNNGKAVLDGVYKISTQAQDPNGIQIKKSTTITIWK